MSLETGYLNLAGDLTFQPPQPSFIPPIHPNDIQPHPSITNIPYHHHVQAQPPINGGWNNAPINHPSGIGHWPTMSLPLPPPPPLLLVQRIASAASHAHSPQLPKKYEALDIEPGPSRKHCPTISVNFDSFETSTYTLNSLPLKLKDSVRMITFNDMYP